MGSEVVGEGTGSQWQKSRESHSLLNFSLSFLQFFFLCIYICMCPLCAHMCICVHIYVCEGQKTISGIFP